MRQGRKEVVHVGALFCSPRNARPDPFVLAGSTHRAICRMVVRVRIPREDASTRVSILQQFATFAQTHGAQRYEELPAHVEPFLQFWIHRHASTADI